MKVCARFALASLLSLLAGGIAYSQESRGNLSGTVSDSQGAVIPGVQVVVKNTDTNAEHRTMTNDTGFFEAPLLTPGMYSITAELQGFKKTVRTNSGKCWHACSGGSEARKLGQLADTFEVSAEAPLIETRSASGGRLVTGREIAELPVPSMNPFRLAGLAARVCSGPELRAACSAPSTWVAPPHSTQLAMLGRTNTRSTALR